MLRPRPVCSDICHATTGGRAKLSTCGATVGTRYRTSVASCLAVWQTGGCCWCCCCLVLLLAAVSAPTTRVGTKCDQRLVSGSLLRRIIHGLAAARPLAPPQCVGCSELQYWIHASVLRRTAHTHPIPALDRRPHATLRFSTPHTIEHTRHASRDTPTAHWTSTTPIPVRAY